MRIHCKGKVRQIIRFSHFYVKMFMLRKVSSLIPEDTRDAREVRSDVKSSICEWGFHFLFLLFSIQKQLGNFDLTHGWKCVSACSQKLIFGKKIKPCRS